MRCDDVLGLLNENRRGRLAAAVHRRTTSSDGGRGKGGRRGMADGWAVGFPQVVRQGRCEGRLLSVAYFISVQLGKFVSQVNVVIIVV